jgi:hypothetical protein
MRVPAQHPWMLWPVAGSPTFADPGRPDMACVPTSSMTGGNQKSHLEISPRS